MVVTWCLRGLRMLRFVNRKVWGSSEMMERDQILRRSSAGRRGNGVNDVGEFANASMSCEGEGGCRFLIHSCTSPVMSVDNRFFFLTCNVF